MRDLGQPNAAAIRSNVPQLGHRLAGLESGWATPVYSVRREPTLCHGARRPPDDDLMLGRLDASRCPTLNLESGLEKSLPPNVHGYSSCQVGTVGRVQMPGMRGGRRHAPQQLRDLVAYLLGGTGVSFVP
jgi:hypothetical protein